MKLRIRKRVIIPFVALLLVGLVLQVGLWHSRGGLIEFIRGQLPARPAAANLRQAIQGADPRRVYKVTITTPNGPPLQRTAPEYLSFSLDTSQIVGGKWWDPEARGKELGSGTVHARVFDFERPLLNRLTAALRPAYLRIGGSEADKVFYDMTSQASHADKVPAGYESALTAAQWDAVQRFKNRNGLKLVFTLNAGPSARDANGAWVPDNADALLTHSARQGYQVDVWELGNELNIFWFIYGIRFQVPIAQYHQDLARARRLVKRHFPQSRFAGQSGAFWPVLGEPLNFVFGFTPAYLAASGKLTDIVGWHYYPQQSRRGPIASRRAYPARLLKPAYLDEAKHWAGRVTALRDAHAPGKPVWLAETGNAQFGGEPGVSDVYIGGLWWLDQLGLLARMGHSVVVRQTLSGMTYALIEDENLFPRPDYWNSLLWKRLMSPDVYAATVAGDNSARLRAYCHGTPGTEDGRTLLIINLDPERSASVIWPALDERPWELYHLNAPDTLGNAVHLNGAPLGLTPEGYLPAINGRRMSASGEPGIRLPPLTYAFVAVVGD